MKTAILQNSVGVGGRSKVLAETVKVFAELGTEITVFTTSKNKSVCRFIDHYNLSRYHLNFRLLRGVTSAVPGTLYQQPALNWNASDALQEYDFVFNSNNCLRFLPSGPTYIHYVHLPVPAIPYVNERYSSSVIYQIYAIPAKTMHYLASRVTQEGIAVTNSHFTASHYEQVYDSPPDKVIYPPCIESVSLESFSGEGVVTLGSFHPNKRQLFQIQIAEQLPQISFTLIGSSASPDYYRQCSEYIDDHDVDNVTLRQDASAATVEKVLQGSKIFLHSMQNEPFGISTVEALNAGCIPVTHDSGGQREVITDARFRYASKSECVETITLINNEKYTLSVNKIRHELKNYTDSHFQKELQECVNHV